MQPLIAKLSLRFALNEVGLTKAPVPLCIQANRYVPLPERSNAMHVATNKERIELHEYSTDIREPPHIVKTFESLEAFIRAFVVQRIDWACTAYMATVRKDAFEKLKAGDFGEFFEVRKKYEGELLMRLDRYLDGVVFSVMARLSKL